jgi:hypothetical protein
VGQSERNLRHAKDTYAELRCGVIRGGPISSEYRSLSISPRLMTWNMRSKQPPYKIGSTPCHLGRGATFSVQPLP